ncbi:peptide/nickel transport system substrate-binding protein [Faunimonas pinastri]|uniref:Peptide/nickel transport system substrate-binding protein n=1 Tax=Faunimonas pinastri TaxID=1855383 RepID=A0A1H9EMH4_9HYPH|nr:ABC transporter substrate-binding protein [Faunimonas pinastri]SEQ26787.1 peptide/nickel transport system substrate-binding protein [Faunimonas pinastri]
MNRRTGRLMRHLGAATTAFLLGSALTGAALAQSGDRADMMKQHRGGTIRLVAAAAAGTMDPQINYTLQYWQIDQMLYDGLLAFKKAPGAEGFKVVPDLAEEVPQAQDDGKTYVFKLRKGIKFSNGDEVATKDVVASFQRIFKVNGPTSGTFYNGIVGADACIKTPASCTLDGGIVADDAAGTVTIHLTQADPEFLYKLSVPHAVILPASTPAKDMGTEPIPGTGTYMLKSYNPNQRMTLVRNPSFKEWSADAQPEAFADEVDYDFGLTEEAAITAIQNGQADWMFDPPPADRLNEIGTKNANQVHLSPLTAIWYAPMNTNLAPFNNLKVRQALNYAVDRDAVVGLFGGATLGQPTCQILPPDFPGHVDSCIYTQDPGDTWSGPDMDKAKQLIAESGTKGQKITIITEDAAVSKNIGGYFQSLLNDLGYDASVKPISSNIQFTYIQNTSNNVQISISQWYQDYPAASDFLNVLLSCDSFHPGSDSSINIAGLCDKDMDGRMKAALKQAVTDPDGANKQWAEIDKAFMEKAPWVPLFNPKHVDFTSSRVANFEFSNQFYWLIANSWVK